VAIATGHAVITMHRANSTAVSPSTEELEIVLRHVLRRQEIDRQKLACLAHDDLGQLLAMLKLNLEAASRKPDSLPTRLKECLDLVQRAVHQTRRFALEARPALLDDLGLVPALRWLMQTRTQASGVNAMVVAEPELLVVPAHCLDACFRVAEEAVSNALRHAQARNLAVEIRDQDNAITMAIRDDGVGFVVAERASCGGLLTMRARVRLAGGDFDLHSQPGSGTVIHVRFVRERLSKEAENL
jgi:signal transduction histidine kinase